MTRRIRITRPDPSVPWGFRIQGGRDFGQPLVILAVTAGGLVEQYGLQPGCQLLSIGGDLVHSMTHEQAQQAVICCGNDLDIETIDSNGYRSQASPSYYQPAFTSPTRRGAYPDGGRPHTTLNINLARPAAAPGPTVRPVLYSPQKRMGYQSETTLVPSKVQSSYTAPRRTQAIYNKPQQQQQQQQQPRPQYQFNRPGFQFKPHVAAPMRSSLNPISMNRSNYREDHVSPRSPPVSGLREAKLQPSGFRLHPICQRCGKEIHGPFVDTIDHCFCPEHFTCDVCHSSLNGRSFSEQDGKFFCEQDFVNLIADRCAKCGRPIIGKIIKALDKKWHPQCFVCCYCKKPLEEKFHAEDAENVLCEEHWQQLHLTECAKCGQSISEIDRFLEAFGKQYHAHCFCCAACQKPLEGKPFHSRDGKPFCPAHANAVALYG